MSHEQVYPGAYPEVVEVGAVDFNGQIADFSNTNREIDFVAPGVKIMSTFPGGGYAQMSGTSMATPHVSGAAALYWSTMKKPTPEKVYKRLCYHAVDLGFSRNAQGHGLVSLRQEEKRQMHRKDSSGSSLIVGL